jgi:histidinol-phosphate aminotransferase
MFDLQSLVRPNILALQPYSSARDEFKQTDQPLDNFVFLDANENSLGGATGTFSRYPDPLQRQLKAQIAQWRGVAANQIFLGNGSDEAIDLLFRIFCEPQADNVICCPPTYGMYEVAANINNVSLKKVNLSADYQLVTSKILAAIDQHTKLIFVCSPNNPTGNSIDLQSIITLLQNFKGIVVIDEAYIDFAATPSWLHQLKTYPNLMVLQTLSKAYGLAALRLGMAFASVEIVNYLNKVKPPYNINAETQRIALAALAKQNVVQGQVATIKTEREKLSQALSQLQQVEQVYPSEANFLLVRTKNADALYAALLTKQIVVRNRSKVALCENCLRITIGTPSENQKLIAVLQELEDVLLP